ncbi:DEAD/DEAH box helicase family protein [Undibacterium sp. GrIS 1.2]|uniref:DEAD/DEAH box helicase n=1 Tax=Undibacterium sp. GrIS 1.2 TaxID=3143933 RepID=UPI003394B7F2
MSESFDFNKPAIPLMEPEEFQRRIIGAMTQHLTHQPSPALLVAPTGAGKTFMLSQVLAKVCSERPTLWFWFTPYANLVGQTVLALDWIKELRLYAMSTERQRDHSNGDVLIANAQQVSSKSADRQVLKQVDDFSISVQGIVARARANKLKIGVVVDEAHIGLSSETEFGKFVKRLKPDSLVMATATPNDIKLNQFLAASGFGENKTFSVSRQEAVDALLNKEFIAAYVYRVSDEWKSLVDLQRTVLRQAWKKHCALKNLLVERGIQTVPLLLVQVGNGENTTREAFEFLTRECGVHPELIGEHTAQAPDPELMNTIAHDTSKEVLIFKEAAGTGFDAPRAFVLASTKPVTDKDYALQFVGRVMRVDQRVREITRTLEKQGKRLSDDLRTAYIYLANAAAQDGYQKAVTVLQGIKSSLEGETERLKRIKTRNGGPDIFTNRPTPQSSMLPEVDWDTTHGSNAETVADSTVDNAEGQSVSSNEVHPSVKIEAQAGRTTFVEEGQGLLFDGDIQPDWDNEETYVPPRLLKIPAKNRDDLRAAFNEIRLSLYPRNDGLPHFAPHLLTELRPSVVDLAKVVKRIAQRLEYSVADLNNALAAATGHTQAIEQRTELVTRQRAPDTKIVALIRREELHRQAKLVLLSTAQFEDADVRQFVQILTSRIQVDAESNGIAVMIDESERDRIYRDMAHDLVRMKADDVVALYHDAISQVVTSRETKSPLPDYMAFPSDLPLLPSAKNSYGVLPPRRNEDMPQVESFLVKEERQFLKHRQYHLRDESTIWVDGYNGTHAMYESENEFAKQLDEAEFVLWWHRNPDRADYGVAVVRPDSHLNFWPDFILCVQYYSEAEPTIRLADTKHDLKDAFKKSRREHKDYKKIIFLTKDNDNLYIVNDNGTKGVKVNSDLSVLRETLRRTDN